MLNAKVKILLYANNIWMLGEGLFGPLYAVFTAQIGGSVLDITWAWAVYLVVTGVSIVFVGAISDRPGIKRKLLVAGYGLNALCTFAYLWVDVPWKLFVVEGGLGLAAALATPTWYALYSTYQPKNERGFSWGLAQGQSKILLAISMVIGGFVVSYASFELLFISMGAIQVIALIIQAQIFRWEDTELRRVKKRVKRAAA